mmetsp:Transcript_35920/g.75559  ORF Transcript_35920/g.75559 Transcript_35920/m.75559 type:complete len:106 (-) Transcript_35920:410-727(-)
MPETGISLINFMPRLEMEMGKIRRTQHLCRMTDGTWMQEAKNVLSTWVPPGHLQTHAQDAFHKVEHTSSWTKSCATPTNGNGKNLDMAAANVFCERDVDSAGGCI